MSTSPLSITIYRGAPRPGVFVWSPFVTKVEARFRFSGLSYRTDAGSPMKSPRGKLPYIRIHKEDSSDSQLISDSTLITETLVRNGMLNDLNSGLSPVEKAQDAAVRALLEDKLYFYQVRNFESLPIFKCFETVRRLTCPFRLRSTNAG